MNKNMMFPTSTPKTTGQKVANVAITLILISFIAYVFEKLFLIILKPFQYLLMKSEDFQELYVEKAKEKKVNREKRIELFKQDETDPMVQYRRRYIEHPENYIGNFENEKYLQWYKDWRKGRIDDYELRWAPAVYSNKELNPEFVSYIELQAGLFNACGYKKAFLKTICKFYPELTPKFPEILEDIKQFKSIIEEKNLHNELYTELKAMGISDALVKEVIKMEPSKIQESAQYFKKCSEFGYTDSVSLALMKIGADPDSETARVISEWMTKALVPARVMIALGKSEIEADDIKQIADVINETCETCGTVYAYTTREDGRCLIDDKIDKVMNQARERMMAKKIG